MMALHAREPAHASNTGAWRDRARRGWPRGTADAHAHERRSPRARCNLVNAQSNTILHRPPTSVSGLYVFAELSLTSCPGRIPDDCFRDVYRTTLMRKHARAILAYRITYDTQKAEPSVERESAREHATTDPSDDAMAPESPTRRTRDPHAPAAGLARGARLVRPESAHGSAAAVTPGYVCPQHSADAGQR